MVSRDRSRKDGAGQKKKGLTVQRAAREAPFGDGTSEGEGIPASPTEVLAVPSALAARRPPSQTDTPAGNAAPVAPTVRLGLRNSSMSGPPSPADEPEDLRTVAISAHEVRDPFGGEATESFDPQGNRGAAPPTGDDGNPTVRFSVAEADTALRNLNAVMSSSETPAPAQPEWFVNGRKVELPRPPGGAPSVFGDLPSTELPPPPDGELAPDADPSSTRPTISDANIQFTPPPPRARGFFWPVLLAVVVAIGAGGVTAWATGVLEPALDEMPALARTADAEFRRYTGYSLLEIVMPAWATAPEPVAPVVVEVVTTPPPPSAPVPIPVRIDLVNDASGSEFAPLSDPMRDRFLSTLFKIKPFVGTKKGTSPRYRFTLFIGGTDVIRTGKDVKGTTSCSLAASEEGTPQPATLLKASATHQITSSPVVVGPAKKKMSKKARAAHAKQVEAAERAEQQVRRQVARTTVSRCAYELATGFAEKALAADAAKAEQAAPAPAPHTPPLVPQGSVAPNDAVPSPTPSSTTGALPATPHASDTMTVTAAPKDTAAVAP